MLTWLKCIFLVLATTWAVACSGNRNEGQDITQKQDRTEKSSSQKHPGPSKKATKPASGRKQKDEIPQKVYEVLDYVRAHGRAPEGYQGGRKFGNYEKHLPRRDASGSPMRYREWDVNPKVKGKNRGAERLITSENKHAWYTRDHYNSFTQID